MFLTNEKSSVTPKRLQGKCLVMFVEDYVNKRCADFEDRHVYVCDSKYLGKRLHFKRLSTWPHPEDYEHFTLTERDEPVQAEKTETSEFVREDSVSSCKKSEDAGKETANGATVSADQDDDEEEEDERMKDLPYVLDLQREEVVLKRPSGLPQPTAEEEEGSAQPVAAGPAPENAEESAQPTAAAPDADPDTATQRPPSAGIVYFEQICSAGRFYRPGDFVLVFNERKPHCDVMRIEKIWQAPSGERFFSGAFFARPKEVFHEPSTRFYKREVIAVEERERVEVVDRIQARCAVLTTRQFETCE